MNLVGLELHFRQTRCYLRYGHVWHMLPRMDIYRQRWWHTIVPCVNSWCSTTKPYLTHNSQFRPSVERYWIRWRIMAKFASELTDLKIFVGYVSGLILCGILWDRWPNWPHMDYIHWCKLWKKMIHYNQEYHVWPTLTQNYQSRQT